MPASMMTTPSTGKRAGSRLLVLLLPAALAVGCDRTGEGSADARICLPFAAQATAGAPVSSAPGGEAATLEDCLHRQAYRLARAAGDPAETVAGAVTAACGDSLSKWNAALVNGPGAAGGVPGAPPSEAIDLVTGQQASPIAQRYAFAQGRALYYVVQARAGRCAIP